MDHHRLTTDEQHPAVLHSSEYQMRQSGAGFQRQKTADECILPRFKSLRLKFPRFKSVSGAETRID
jgi:hypothetical protein